MGRHGRETYYIVGEGVVGDDPGAAATRMEQSVAADIQQFRFSRIGPQGSQLGEANIRAVSKAMVAGDGATKHDSGIPAGYTYLGQFIDHDLTRDVTPGPLDRDERVVDLLQERSPGLDLDSLYGKGPNDPNDKNFYNGLRLKTGTTAPSFPADGIANKAKPGFDLPRVGTGATKRAKRRALIPDVRNDENLAVAQTHLAFIRFHNRVVDELAADGVPVAQRFAKARELVVKHYQWMIHTDFLPRLVDKAIVENVFTKGRKLFEVSPPVGSFPTMPVEFSVAAYRLGHSMIRDAYDWNRVFDNGAGSLEFLFAFSGTGGNLDAGGDQSDPGSGALALPTNWICDFRRLYDFREAGRLDLVPKPRAKKFNVARRIDTLLAEPLARLPRGSIGFPGAVPPAHELRLSYRNLRRAKKIHLATGQQMVDLLNARGVPVKALTPAQILNGKDGAKLGRLTVTQKATVERNTPLWFYILREAELNGGKLTGVGGRIVAETFHRAIEGSQDSILKDRAFRPTLGPNAMTFRMVDLLLFAFEGKAALLNPLGD